MKSLHKSVLIWHSAQQMFDLVADVASYPQFLPWCSHSRVLERRPDGLSAEIGLSFAGLKHSFATNNVHEARADGSLCMRMQLVRGPFSHLQGEWWFTPIDTKTVALDETSLQAAPQACRVDLNLQYSWGKTLGFLIGPAFDKVAMNLVDAFVQRASEVYGEA